MPHTPTPLPDPISLTEAACLLAGLPYTTLMPTHGGQVVLIDGNGAYGSTTDIALIWSTNHAPIVLAVYFTQPQQDAPVRKDVLAAVGRIEAGGVVTCIGEC